MNKFIGYFVVFVLGFALCAGLFYFVPRSTVTNILPSGVLNTLNGGNNNPPTQASPQGREQIGKALERAPVVRELPGSNNNRLAGTSAVADAAAKVEPAVVNIDVTGTRRVGGDNPMNPFGGGGFERRFQGSGSGIVLSADGYVVTNNHVVKDVADRSGTISIVMDNGKVYPDVRIVGRDPQSDLAVLKIANVTNLPAASLGDSDSLRVGDWAIAVGNPLGFNSTVTLGIISALNRSFRQDSDALDRVLQTDAAINPGNSGGALADINGQVIGINTAIASTQNNEGSVGIGFAIPINTAKRIIKQLVETGKVVRPYLGVSYQPLAKTDRNLIKQDFPNAVLPTDNLGALIAPKPDGTNAIRPGSPAERAGLRPFDVIRDVDGKPVDEKNDVRTLIQNKNVGDRVIMKIWRAGGLQDVTVTLETMPQNYMAPVIPAPEENTPQDNNSQPDGGQP